MAWRPTQYLIEGELDNTHPGKVTGWMSFAGMTEKVTFSLQGDFHRDIRGAKIHLTGDASATDPLDDAAGYMEDFAPQQTGRVGDITAGLPPADYVSYPYVEWYSQENGRVVLELEADQVEVIGRPIPACESDPISREQQNRNMAEFLGSLAAEIGLPAERAVCISRDAVVTSGRAAANNKVRGMKLLTQAIRRRLPSLYSQDGKGRKAIAHVRFFTPDSSWTWWVTEGSPVRDGNGQEVDFQFFGLVEGHVKELGYFNLSELEEARGPMGLPIERDLHWQPKPLEEIAPEMFRASKGTEG